MRTPQGTLRPAPRRDYSLRRMSELRPAMELTPRFRPQRPLPEG